MSRNKRQNENSQLRKDDWEVLNDNDSKNDENINDLFKTASHQELKQRPIVKALRPSTGHSSIGSTTVSAGGNPFGSIQLAAEATPKPNRNPFASISLAAPAPATFVFAPISFTSIYFTAEELGQISSTPTTTTAKSTTITSTDSQSVAMPFQFNKTVVPNFSSSASSLTKKLIATSPLKLNEPLAKAKRMIANRSALIQKKKRKPVALEEDTPIIHGLQNINMTAAEDEEEGDTTGAFLDEP
mmetsp:Transcript_7238/g.10520  ORF Transcript_7238/g.10520 Transcript_7238/m.10520 type:complete len:243 (-) Transcript_7238:3381-4109(-)